MNGMRYLEFDGQFLNSNRELLHQICELYCVTWAMDPFFGEYRKCPNCKMWYSHDDVEKKGITSCSTCQVTLKVGWLPVSVGLDLMEASRKPSLFCGYLALDDDKVIGFSWGKFFTKDAMTRRFSYLPGIDNDVFYLEELAVAASHRGHGYGKELAKRVFEETRTRRPELRGCLSTHEKSVAFGMYQKMGMRLVTRYPTGQGRVHMGIDRLSDLVIS